MRISLNCRVFLALLLCWTVTGCASDQNHVELKGQRFSVELALTRDEQMRGLMFRESLAEDHGMLFIFPGEAPRSFWMKNTRIPLDIFYFDEELKLVSVAHNARPCVAPPCVGYPSAGPARYVLELNAGAAARLDVRQGDPLTLALAQ